MTVTKLIELALALAQAVKAFAAWLTQAQALEAGRAAGRADSDAEHAREAAAIRAEMEAIAGKPAGESEIDRRLEGGSG